MIKTLYNLGRIKVQLCQQNNDLTRTNVVFNVNLNNVNLAKRWLTFITFISFQCKFKQM